MTTFGYAGDGPYTYTLDFDREEYVILRNGSPTGEGHSYELHARDRAEDLNRMVAQRNTWATRGPS